MPPTHPHHHHPDSLLPLPGTFPSTSLTLTSLIPLAYEPLHQPLPGISAQGDPYNPCPGAIHLLHPGLHSLSLSVGKPQLHLAFWRQEEQEPQPPDQHIEGPGCRAVARCHIGSAPSGHVTYMP